QFKKIPDDELKIDSFKGMLKDTSLFLVAGLAWYRRTHVTLRRRTTCSIPHYLPTRNRPPHKMFQSHRVSLSKRPHSPCRSLLDAVVEQMIMSEANASLTAKVNALKAEVARFKGENVELKRENGTLKGTKRKADILEYKVGVHTGVG
ncbi:hypothetical protein J3R82DRAFT_10258, partial [Butyriboletus roseoflavus]